MRIRLDINGRDIGAIGVHNERHTNDGTVIYGIYDIRGHEGGDSFDDHERIGEVEHDPRDGAATLGSLVLHEVDEEYLDE